MGSELTIATEERDLEVMINSSMQTSAQCLAAVKKKKKANQLIGVMRERTENKQKTIIPLYKAMVHLDVENYVQF